MQTKIIVIQTRLIVLASLFALAACRPATPSTQTKPSESSAALTVAATTAPMVAAKDTGTGMDEGAKRVVGFLDNLTKADAFSGAVLIARDGQIVLSKGYGLADHKSNTPNTPQTIFRIGELSMQFTAAATLLLEQDGKLSMQDGICKYLDHCPDIWKDITIHQLLSHTSGIPDYLDTAAGQKATHDGATPQQLVAAFRDLSLAQKPGAQRIYSRSGFVLAGLIIERVSGQSYADFVAKRIFAPLGMTSSGCGAPHSGLVPGYSSSTTTTPYTFNFSALYAAGECYSTAEDLFRWNEGLHNEKLLNAAQLKKMLTAHAPLPNDPVLKSGYGIVLGELAGRKGAGNGGGPDGSGYFSVLDRYFDDHVTVLIVGNQTLQDQFGLSDQVEKLYFGES